MLGAFLRAYTLREMGTRPGVPDLTLCGLEKAQFMVYM